MGIWAAARFFGERYIPMITCESLISGLTMNVDEFDEELETIRKIRMEELKMSNEGNNWPDKPVNVTDSNFKEFTGQYPTVVVDCWAPWCSPCRIIGPIIDELAGDYKGKIAFGKLNTDENQVTAMSLGIMSIPTLLVFKNGELVDKIIGAMPRQALEPRLQSHL